jgi:membrane-bound inhibitor of C-type lysozyme
MQTILKNLFVATILVIGTVGTALAADPAIGTWTLNLAKSTFSPGPAPKSQTRTYAESAQGIMLTVKTTAADGKETTTTLTFKADGKPYPVSGNPDFDMVSVKRVNALTVHTTQRKGSATVGTGVRTVSKDGKTLTFAQKGTAASGAKYDNKAVYDRQ